MTRVMIVDDDPATIDVGTRVLSGSGYTVESIGSLTGAHDKAKAFRPDVVLLDVMLGDGLGYEFARKLRRDPLLHKVCILFVSSVGTRPEVDFAVKQGGDAYLVKPITKQALLEKVAQMSELAQSTAKPDPLTGLSSLGALKREIDFRLFRSEAFAMCLVDVVGLGGVATEEAAALKATILRRIAGAFGGMLKSAGFYETTLSHFGQGQFGVALPKEDLERFCGVMLTTFEQVVLTLQREKVGAQAVDYSRLSVHIATVELSSERFQRSQEVLESTARALRGAKRDGQSKVVSSD